MNAYQRTFASVLSLAVVASSGLAGCASTANTASTASTSTSETVPPVIVKTDGDAATLLATNPFKATHFKIGARWYPRCRSVGQAGTRLTVGYACLSDAEVAEIAQSGQLIIDDLNRRGPTPSSFGGELRSAGDLGPQR